MSGSEEGDKMKESEECATATAANTNAIVVNARQHSLASLALILSKQLLKGDRVVVVCCEEIQWRIDNPSRVPPPNSRSPSNILSRFIRGMIPHETKRADRAAALARFKAYDGVPPPYDKMMHRVIPKALMSHVMRPGHKYCLLRSFSKDLKEKRKEKAKVAHDRRKQLATEAQNDQKLQILEPLIKCLSLSSSEST